MAAAPQNVTRIVAGNIVAPPDRAPTAPSMARKISDAAETVIIIIDMGVRNVASSGSAAPTENVAADVTAACTGRADTISEIPSSSSIWVPS